MTLLPDAPHCFLIFMSTTVKDLFHLFFSGEEALDYFQEDPSLFNLVRVGFVDIFSKIIVIGHDLQ